MSKHRKDGARRQRAGQAVGVALVAGGMLLAAPAGLAFAAPPAGGGDNGGSQGGNPPPGGGSGGTPGGGGPVGGGTGGKTSVGNRPALKHPAPVLKGIQHVGDSVYDQPKYSDTAAADRYHRVFGASGHPQDADGILGEGEAYQGAYRGVLNEVFDPDQPNSARSGTAEGCIAVRKAHCD